MNSINFNLLKACYLLCVNKQSTCNGIQVNHKLLCFSSLINQDKLTQP